ncbi:MAG: hypothetical protein ACRECL_20385, partial [Bradyrhizobium sp.]
LWFARPAPAKRGASRSSRTLGAGCDGREDVAETNNIDADGKAVWFWHPLAGAKFATMSSLYRASDGDYEVMDTGKSTE